jgi:hypothetical protein
MVESLCRTIWEATNSSIIASEMLREKLKYNRDLMRAMSLSNLVVRLTLVGAVSGFIAWAVMLVAHLVLEVDRPAG